MATAVVFRLNDSGERVVRDVEAALMHVADNLLDGRGQPERLRKAIADEVENYAYLEPAGAVPHLAAILERDAKATGRESVAFEIHDLDAKPGFDGLVLQYDLVDDLDPACAILKALTTVAEDGLSEEDAELELESVIMRAVGQARRFGDDAAKGLERLRARQDAFGPPPGSPLRIVPDAVAGEDAKHIAATLGGRAAERFREILSKLDLSDAPAP